MTKIVTATNLKYSLVSSPPKINQYVVNVSFEHGDGDMSDEEDIVLHDCSEEQFIDWLNRFYEFQELFDNQDILENFEEDYADRLIIHGYYIPYELDCYDHDHEGVYARMSIQEIIYWGPTGDKWNVDIKG